MKKNIFLSHAIDKLGLKNKRVLLRVDLNVPTECDFMTYDHKYKSISPTIELLRSKGAKIIIATHIGRPEKERVSTKILLPFFSQYNTIFEPDIDKAIQISKKNDYDILLLENLRFFEGEKTCSKDFANKLAQLGDYFVNDAFGVLHRKEASTTLLPAIFGKGKSFLGPLVENELNALAKLKNNPEKPFVFILGGKKIHSKLPLIEKMLDKVDTILLCPAMSGTFAKQAGKSVGKSLVDDSLLGLIPDILKKAKKHNVTIMLPVDYQIAKDNFDGPISYIKTEEIPKDYLEVSIGEKTVKLFVDQIKKGKTAFFNGAFGNSKHPESLHGIKELFKAMNSTEIFSVIAGGSSVLCALTFGLVKNIDHLSTGGGASFTYISGEKLPGLDAFETLT